MEQLILSFVVTLSLVVLGVSITAVSCYYRRSRYLARLDERELASLRRRLVAEPYSRAPRLLNIATFLRPNLLGMGD